MGESRARRGRKLGMVLIYADLQAYQAFYGLMVCPFYALGQTMISEVVPRGKEVRRVVLLSLTAALAH
jgi:MFS family permease